MLGGLSSDEDLVAPSPSRHPLRFPMLVDFLTSLATALLSVVWDM
jgi:hypothetical protein